MLTDEVKKELTEICPAREVFFDYPLSGRTSIGIGGKTDVWITPIDPETLQRAVNLLKSASLKIKVIGNASNILIADTGFEGAIIKLAGDFFDRVTIKDNVVTVGGGTSLRKLVADCCRHGLGGLEGAAGIPATIGGAIKMNASYKSAVSEKLTRVFILDKHGKYAWREKKEIEFGYRTSSFDREEIITRAEFCLEKVSAGKLKEKLGCYLREKAIHQPLDEKTLGCIFKNPGKNTPASGELIDRSGMKGVGRGNASVSEKHANFIVNTGGASSLDVMTLIGDIQKKVKKVFHVNLEPEIEIL